jgi:hypothetical protein
MKTCQRCKETKGRSEFYSLKKAPDGLLGTCKSCVCSDVRRHYRRCRQDARWVAKERARGRLKNKRRLQLGLPHPTSKETLKRYCENNPIKKRSHWAAARALRKGVLIRPENCEHCGASGRLLKHHPDYSQPLKVTWLCSACHGIQHRKPMPAWTEATRRAKEGK